MIVLNLRCAIGHDFEGWFASRDAFDHQLEQKLVRCPHCDSDEIRSLPTASRISTTANAVENKAGNSVDRAQIERLAFQLRELASRCEDVGSEFAEEVRRMHSGKVDSRDIKGIASDEEVRDLIEDGIPILSIPEDETQH